MILEVQGLFAGKWVKLKYKIPIELLEKKVKDDTLFGFNSIEEFKQDHSFKDNLILLERFPDAIEMVSGGRLDIIARTKPEILYDLSDYRLERDNLTLLERLIEVLKNIEQYPEIESYISMCVSVTNVSDGVSILQGKKM